MQKVDALQRLGVTTRTNVYILSRIATLAGKNMRQRLILAALVMSFGSLANADTPPIRDAARGELLYETHCVACHSAQVHWREKKLATDWASLQSEVRRWEQNSGLGWSDQDIADVARYLNALHYGYPMPESRVGLNGG